MRKRIDAIKAVPIGKYELGQCTRPMLVSGQGRRQNSLADLVDGYQSNDLITESESNVYGITHNGAGGLSFADFPNLARSIVKCQGGRGSIAREKKA